jgi:hypothetical protein
VFLGTATPGDVPGNFHSALAALADRATYFYSAGGRYWYDLQANISRRAKDQAERLHPEDVWAQIVERLKDQSRTRAAFAGVHVCPDNTADIPDTDEARLIILHPKAPYQRKDLGCAAMTFAHRATEHRGTANRSYRNMVVFLAPDIDRMAELDHAVRDYLGWAHVLEKQDELDLTQNQKNQASDKRKQADQTVTSRLLGAYQWALIPEQPEPGGPFVINATKVEGQATALAERIAERLGKDGALTTQQAPAAIRYALDHKVPSMWTAGHVSVGDLWKVYASYPYMPRLRDRDVLNAGLTAPVLVWDTDGFALAEGYDETTERYYGLVIPNDHTTLAVSDATLIVKPADARAQRERELSERRATDSGEARGPTIATAPPSGNPAATDLQTAPSKTRYFASKKLSPDRYGTDFKKIVDEVLAHLAATDGVALTVRVEVHAEAACGFDSSKIRTVSENARTLKFEESEFEDK